MKKGYWLLALLAVAALGAGLLGVRPAAAEGPAITVHKTPTCGCCTKWVDHLREHGFQVEIVDHTDLAPIKARYGVPQALHSCHTAVVGDYVVEGHVPADAILRFLDEGSDEAGLAVPGMPMGSPGMEGPYKEAYDVFAFDHDGGGRIFESR